MDKSTRIKSVKELGFTILRIAPEMTSICYSDFILHGNGEAYAVISEDSSMVDDKKYIYVYCSELLMRLYGKEASIEIIKCFLNETYGIKLNDKRIAGKREQREFDDSVKLIADGKIAVGGGYVDIFHLVFRRGCERANENGIDCEEIPGAIMDTKNCFVTIAELV